MFNNYKLLKICDFGSSRQAQHTMTDQTGSLWYMAPEIRSSRNYTNKCDVYSFGIVLSEMITRKMPYDGDQEALFSGSGPKRLPEEPSELISLLKSLWLNNPKLRPSMQDVADQLGCLLTKYPKGNYKKSSLNIFFFHTNL